MGPGESGALAFIPLYLESLLGDRQAGAMHWGTLTSNFFSSEMVPGGALPVPGSSLSSAKGKRQSSDQSQGVIGLGLAPKALGILTLRNLVLQARAGIQMCGPWTHLLGTAPGGRGGLELVEFLGLVLSVICGFSWG